MESRFRYSRYLWLPGASIYLLYGELISGDVSVGMEVRFPLGGTAYVAAPVASVEFESRVVSNAAEIALGLGFANRDEADLVCGWLSPGKVVELGWPFRPIRTKSRDQAPIPQAR